MGAERIIGLRTPPLLPEMTLLLLVSAAYE